MAVPPDALVKGSNVLAISIHRAPVAGPLPNSVLAARRDQRDNPDRRGRRRRSPTPRPTGEPGPGAQTPCNRFVSRCPTSPSAIGGFKWVLIARGAPVKGIRAGNPFDPVLPVRLAAPRKGTGSGQVVLSDAAGLTGVTATVSPLRTKEGLELPAGALQVRFARTVQLATPEPVHYCDALDDKSPTKATTVPVWCIAEIPKEQAPGWYAGTLSLAANGKSFTVPLQVLVTPATVPAPRDGAALIGLTHSPGTLARHYKVDLWSKEHFARLEPSLAMMGQLGNDALQVPVIVHNQFGWQPLVHFTKTDQGLQPDFTVLEKYLDLYAKYCGPPKSMNFYIWDIISAKRIADAYEGRQIPSRDFKPQAAADGTGARCREWCPELRWRFPASSRRARRKSTAPSSTAYAHW